MSVRLYADRCVETTVCDARSQHGFDVLRASDIWGRGAGDDRHLLFASRERRTLVTFDRGFVFWHAAWLHWSEAWGVDTAHSGVLIARAVGRGRLHDDVVAEIVALLQTNPPLSNELYQCQPTGRWQRWQDDRWSDYS